MESDHIQRWTIKVKNKQHFELLSKGYKDWQFWVSPSIGFGQGYVIVASDQSAFQLIVNQEGTYNVLGIAQRNSVH
jgi:hypothetical protein